MASKSDKYYISKTLDEIEIILKYTNNITYEEFMHDEKLIDATMFRLTQMIEQIKNISDEFKQLHYEIPWVDIIGFRNRLVHEYGSTDYSTVYEVISNDIYEIKEIFESSLN